MGCPCRSRRMSACGSRSGMRSRMRSAMPPRPRRPEHPYAAELRAQGRRERQASTRAQTQRQARDRMILEGIAQGMSHRECAVALKISEQRVSAIVEKERARVRAAKGAEAREA